MNEGTLAGGAPARVDADDFTKATDHLQAVWERLAQIANQQAQEVLRFSGDPERFTAHEVVIAWHATNGLVSQAMNHLAFATETLRGQRDGIISALEAAAGNREDQN